MSSKGQRSKRPSMKDVADLAGVSRTTVSFVLNQVPDSNIPEATQERVWAAVEELGYRPNWMARGLRSQRTHTIGFISDVVATTPHANHMIQGAQELAWDHDKLLLLVNVGDNKEMKMAAVNMMLERQVEGIIYATMYHREAHPPKIIKEVPTVMLDCFVADRSLPSVVPDEVLGAYTAVSTLIQKGHKRIGYLQNEEPVDAAILRLEGYKKALAEHGIPFDESLVEAVDDRHGYDGAMPILKRPDRPSALFIFNDRMAMGAYDAIRNLNLKIPNDVAIIGYDNQELIAPNLYPALTTMELPHYEMGYWAVEQLLDLINNPDAQPETAVQYKMECPLIERSSV
ncbi:MAG: LacI family DNA-binding transcriptional regulator [Candidatus Promineifilaceae bacterium]|jgi:LacI family transcriptional regulator